TGGQQATVTGYIADGANVNVTDATTVLTNADSRGAAEANSNAGGIVAAGVASSNAASNTVNSAYLRSSRTLRSGSLTVRAAGPEDNRATTWAGSGGVAAGASASGTTSSTSATSASIGASSFVDLTLRGSGAFLLSADHTATLNSQEKTIAGGVLAGAGVAI